MRFAVFFKESTGYIPGSIPPRFSPDLVKPIEACGSDGVAIFDGRFSIERCATIARDLCARRGFVGFTIENGASFTTGRVIRAFEQVKG